MTGSGLMRTGSRSREYPSWFLASRTAQPNAAIEGKCYSASIPPTSIPVNLPHHNDRGLGEVICHGGRMHGRPQKLSDMKSQECGCQVDGQRQIDMWDMRPDVLMLACGCLKRTKVPPQWRDRQHARTPLFLVRLSGRHDAAMDCDRSRSLRPSSSDQAG
jgi:hypothetical protein